MQQLSFTMFPENLSNIGVSDYYGRVNAASGLPSYGDYGNKQGSGFYGLENQDSAGVPLTTVTMSVFGLNIDTLTDLQVSLFVAEDDAADGFEDWDVASSVRLEAQIDGGGFANIFAIKAPVGRLVIKWRGETPILTVLEMVPRSQRTSRNLRFLLPILRHRSEQAPADFAGPEVYNHGA